MRRVHDDRPAVVCRGPGQAMDSRSDVVEPRGMAALKRTPKPKADLPGVANFVLIGYSAWASSWSREGITLLCLFPSFEKWSRYRDNALYLREYRFRGVDIMILSMILLFFSHMMTPTLNRISPYEQYRVSKDTPFSRTYPPHQHHLPLETVEFQKFLTTLQYSSSHSSVYSN